MLLRFAGFLGFIGRVHNYNGVSRLSFCCKAFRVDRFVWVVGFLVV